MYDKRFWIATSERAIKTLAQALVALFVGGMTILNIDWTQALAVSVTAALVSVLTSLISAPLGKNAGPSLADETIEPDPIIVEVEVAKPRAAAAKKAPAKKAAPKK